MTNNGRTELTTTSLRINTHGAKFSIPRPRSLGEFVLHPSRWRIPNVKNVAMLSRRVRTNLLYFQTNYLIVSLAAFALMMILSMKTLLTGIVSSIIIILAFLFFFEHIPQARQIKQNHPTLVIIGGIVLIIVTWHALHTILWVIGAALVPVPFWLLHAASRSSENLIDSSRSDNFADTPVGQLMQIVGIEPRASLHE